MAVTKEQLADWRNHVVTQELMTELQENMESYIAELVRDSADRSYDRDNWIRAYVAVATDVIGFNPEVVAEEDFKQVDEDEN